MTIFAHRSELTPIYVFFSNSGALPIGALQCALRSMPYGLGGAEAESKFPAIRLVEHEGQLFMLDNRRLLTFSLAGQHVPYRMATETEIAREWVSKFATTNAQGWVNLLRCDYEQEKHIRDFGK